MQTFIDQTVGSIVPSTALTYFLITRKGETTHLRIAARFQES